MRISIRGHSFDLKEPYQAGHPLTAGEAQALNALRAENIRNNLYKRAAGFTTIDSEALAQLITAAADYDNRYRFKERASPASPQADHRWSVDAEALSIARDEAERQWRFGGRTPSDDPEDFAEFVATLASTPAVVSRAISRIEAKKEIARQALDELFSNDEKAEPRA